MQQVEVGLAQPAPLHGCMRKLGRRFVKDRGGQAAVEFGFVMIPFFALLFSIFENAFLLMVDNGVEQALATAARQVLLGAVQNDASITSGAQFRDKMICSPTTFSRVLPTYVDCSKIVVDMQVQTSFANTTPSANFYNNTVKYCTGQPGQIILLSLMYPMPSYFPIFTGNWAVNNGVSTAGLTFYNGDYKHLVVATGVFQNEPFTSNQQSAAGC